MKSLKCLSSQRVVSRPQSVTRPAVWSQNFVFLTRQREPGCTKQWLHPKFTNVTVQVRHCLPCKSGASWGGELCSLCGSFHWVLLHLWTGSHCSCLLLSVLLIEIFSATGNNGEKSLLCKTYGSVSAAYHTGWGQWKQELPIMLPRYLMTAWSTILLFMNSTSSTKQQSQTSVTTQVRCQAIGLVNLQNVSVQITTNSLFAVVLWYVL